ncbi:MAG TPA: hypothetical protein VFC51_11560 [Chloroflexota bacterium]|nr:hypothetical protein [Chloroflexota bacterium]
MLGWPKIDEIDVQFFNDADTLTAALLAGSVDLPLGSSLALEQALGVKDQWPDGGLAINYSSWIVVFPQFINAAQLLNEIGYQKLPDGGWRGADGQRLSLEVHSTAWPAIHTRAFFPLVDYWKRLGLDIDPVVLPVQRLADLEYRTQMPSFEMIRFPNGADNVWRLHSSETPLPANRFTGSNRSRYMSAEFDTMVDRYMTTIPWDDRMQALGDIVHQISDQLIMMGLFYDVKSFMVAKRLTGFTPADNATWNAHTCDIR